jgi:hypothetical protein
VSKASERASEGGRMPLNIMVFLFFSGEDEQEMMVGYPNHVQ